MRKLFALSVCLFLSLSPALAFGPTGHRIVGHIAQKHLTRKARRAVKALIGPQNLAQVATWADEIRSDPKWKVADPWHYITIDDEHTYESAPKNDDGDIIEALNRLEKVLRDPKATREARAEALKFIVHFVGDLHQPLHVGRKADLGGNTIEVKWFGESSNLHRVWDSDIIRHEELSYTEFAAFLDHAPRTQVKSWQNSTYLDWARESKALRDQVYDFGPQRDGPDQPPYLGYAYIFRNGPVVRQRLTQAGIRLAGVLNDIFK